MLEISNLSFRYGKRNRLILEDLNLSLGEGEVGVLLGRNGSGKTTLFKNIIGVEKPSAGDITFDGNNLKKMTRSERARLIGYVPQDIRFGSLTVFESIMIGRISYFGYRPGEADIEAVKEVLQKMGLTEYSDRNVDQLSGGERQKIAIARALAQNPRLLVFDEPTGNLDISNENLILRQARELADGFNISILTSLHDLNQALNFGDRFFFLKDGKIKYNVTRDEVTEDIIRDTFDAEVRILSIEGEKVILGGKIL